MKLIAVLILTAGIAVPSAALAQDGSYCANGTTTSAEVIQLEDTLGCDEVPALALRTIEEGGSLSEAGFTCTWGGSEAEPILANGRIYSEGSCVDEESGDEALFLGRDLTDPASQRVYAGAVYKPKRKWCPTNRTCLTNIKWTTYTTTRAAGVARARDCRGGGGRCRTYRKLKFTLTAPESMCSRIQFSRLQMLGKAFTAGEPVCNVYYAP